VTNLLISDKANIVILDDPQQDLLSLIEALMTDYTVQSFIDGARFINYIEQNHRPIDLIIIEFRALSNDGYDIIARLRKLSHIKNLPIIVSVLLNDKEQERSALALDATDYITKPFSIPIELIRIKNHIHVSWTLQISREQNHYLDLKVSERSEKLVKIHSELIDKKTNILSLEKEILLFLYRTADCHDSETGAHLQRMAHYAKLIAVNLGLSAAEQDLLLKAAPLHDIGKVGISDDILLKPGKLTPQEFEIMKQHVTISYEILQGSMSPLMRAAAELALSHHEKFDGSGYPKGLIGNAIPLFGRIAAVADVFDALTSVRPYKTAWPLQQAVDYLKEQRGKHFDPLCVDAFLNDWPAVLDIHNRYRDDENHFTEL
jgi:response regulator RpfG family c-di-GMP phosphodiesterase